MQRMSIQDAADVQAPAERALEARYAYYRRCQTVCRNGQQCKAPAERGAQTCYAHARQQAMQERRERQRRAVLEEAARQVAMRSALGKERGGWSAQKVGVAELFMDFNAIQTTIAVMAQAVIDGRIDCKTAGRLALELQTASKLLWLQQKAAVKRKPQSRTEQSSSNTSQNVIEGLKQGLKPSYFLSDSNERLNTDFFCGLKDRVGLKPVFGTKDRVGLKAVQIRLRGSPPQETINSQKAA